LLSLVERGGGSSRVVAGLAYRSKDLAYTVGITGSSGAGKSTLTDRLIAVARANGPGKAEGPESEGRPDAEDTERAPGSQQVGVLAIDPSSPFSGGAILGDRVRMQNHALDDGVFIRSMATRGRLGGLSVAVPDAIRVLSAAGFPLVFIETVGVGQQEVDVAAATDTTVVVVNPGWGDAIQANKAGLLEIADLFVINKADRPGARETRRDLEAMLDLTVLDQWRPPIVETVASDGTGVDELWSAINRHRAHLSQLGRLDASRRSRLEREFHRILVSRVEERIDALKGGSAFAEVTDALASGDLDPYEAADRVLGRIAPDVQER
jgi:LAO/AO transport system kinase